MHYAANNSNERASIVCCPDLEFLCGKFSTARLGLAKFKTRRSLSDEYDGYLGDWISIQEPLTRPGVKPDEKMSICSSTPQHGGYTNSSLLEGDVKVRKCHAMLFLRTCMSRKWM